MLKTPLEELIEIAGGQSALAETVTKSSKYLSQSTISAWLNRFNHRVGPEYVLPICRSVDWRMTPHRLRPDLYPHPHDGLPEHLRVAA